MCVPGLGHFTCEGHIQNKKNSYQHHIAGTAAVSEGLRQSETMIVKAMALIIHQPVQRLHHISNQDCAISRGPRGSGMPEKWPESNERPGDALHGARPGMGVQCMCAIVIRDPEAASLPTSTRDDHAFVATRIVLTGVHLYLHVTLSVREENSTPGQAPRMTDVSSCTTSGNRSVLSWIPVLWAKVYAPAEKVH